MSHVAAVNATQSSRGAVTTHLPAAPPPLASFTGGVGLSLPSGGNRIGQLTVTELTVIITRRDDARVTWSGSAVTVRVADSQAGAIAAVARSLADAVLA